MPLLHSSKKYVCRNSYLCQSTPLPIDVNLNGLWVAGQTLFVHACTHCYTAYPGCAAPTGLKQLGFLLTHRLRSGLLLLHPDGVSLSCPVRGNTTMSIPAHQPPVKVSLSCPVRGNTIVAHCVSGGKAIARRYQAPEGRHKHQNIQTILLYNTKKSYQRPYLTDGSR